MNPNHKPILNADIIGTDPLARLLAKARPWQFALGVATKTNPAKTERRRM